MTERAETRQNMHWNGKMVSVFALFLLFGRGRTSGGKMDRSFFFSTLLPLLVSEGEFDRLASRETWKSRSSREGRKLYPMDKCMWLAVTKHFLSDWMDWKWVHSWTGWHGDHHLLRW